MNTFVSMRKCCCWDLLAAPPWGPTSLISDVKKGLKLLWSHEGNSVNSVAPGAKYHPWLKQGAGKQVFAYDIQQIIWGRIFTRERAARECNFSHGFNDYNFERILINKEKNVQALKEVKPSLFPCVCTVHVPAPPAMLLVQTQEQQRTSVLSMSGPASDGLFGVTNSRQPSRYWLRGPWRSFCSVVCLLWKDQCLVDGVAKS